MESKQEVAEFVREEWDVYFMRIAHLVAQRATCRKRMVGSVLVRDKRILSTGYNGSLSGQPHCMDVGCEIQNGKCIRTVHSETNAILQSAVPTKGSTLYCTYLPCRVCFKLLATAGVVKIIYDEQGTDISTLQQTQVVCQQLSLPEKHKCQQKDINLPIDEVSMQSLTL